MAMTGDVRLSTSSTSATDFSRPTSNGATAPGKRTALRIGRTGSSSPNWRASSSVDGREGGGGGAFFSDMVFILASQKRPGSGRLSSHPKHASCRAPGSSGRCDLAVGLERVDGETGKDLRVEEGALLRHHLARLRDAAHL